MSDERNVEDELEALASAGLDSGEPIEPSPTYWEAKHRKLDEVFRAAKED